MLTKGELVLVRGGFKAEHKWSKDAVDLDLIPLAVAVAIYGPVLFGVRLATLMGVQID